MKRSLGDKMLKLFEKGSHAKSFNDNPESYENTVKEFLLKFGFLSKLNTR